MASVKHPIVGTVSFQPLAKGAIRLLGGWEQNNISVVHIPELKGVPTYSGKFSGNVRFYKLAVPQFKAAWDAVGRSGLIDKVLFWSGSFVPRMKRGSTTSPSEHTFGCAFDINHQQNPFKRNPAPVGAHGDVHAIAGIFKAFGFEWGGDWKSTPDGMHFQVKRLMTAAEIAAVSGRIAPYASPPTAPTPAEPPQLVLNAAKAPTCKCAMIGNELWVPARPLIEALGHKITGVNNSIESKQRFYLNTTK